MDERKNAAALRREEVWSGCLSHTLRQSTRQMNSRASRQRRETQRRFDKDIDDLGNSARILRL